MTQSKIDAALISRNGWIAGILIATTAVLSALTASLHAQLGFPTH
jgi:hypothetical protein